jgi:hypothetical protein
MIEIWDNQRRQEPVRAPNRNIEDMTSYDIVSDMMAYKRAEIVDQINDELHNLIAGRTYLQAMLERRLQGASIDYLFDDLIHEVGQQEWLRDAWIYCYGSDDDV